MENIPDQILQSFLISLGTVTSEKLQRQKREFTLRFSNIGTPCVRKLWLEKRHPDDKIPLRPESLLKFSFGDLTEEYLLFLAELAGHRVELRQQEVTLAGIKGHWDAVVDGTLIDTKSASSFSFKKFQNGLIPETDAFGYLGQLRGYFHEAVKFPEVTNKKQAGFLVFDKQHGHLCLDLHEFDTDGVEEFFEERKRIVASDQIPDRSYEPVPDGQSGNMKLPVNCSYCDMKHKCHDKIRTFLYSYGPVYLVKTVREPKVLEVT